MQKLTIIIFAALLIGCGGEGDNNPSPSAFKTYSGTYSGTWLTQRPNSTASGNMTLTFMSEPVSLSDISPDIQENIFVAGTVTMTNFSSFISSSIQNTNLTLISFKPSSLSWEAQGFAFIGYFGSNETKLEGVYGLISGSYGDEAGNIRLSK